MKLTEQEKTLLIKAIDLSISAISTSITNGLDEKSLEVAKQTRKLYIVLQDKIDEIGIIKENG